jgi:hypothetical protein
VRSGVPNLGYIDAATEQEDGGFTGCSSSTNYSPLNEASRHCYVKEAESKVKLDSTNSHNMDGIFMDDVNWQCGKRQEHQEKGPTCESKGGEPEAKEEALLIKEVSTAIKAVKSTAQLDINSHWSDYHNASPALHERYVAALPYITLLQQEFGFGDLGTLADYEGYVNELTELRKRSSPVHATIDRANELSSTEPKRLEEEEYELASYYLVNDGSDYIAFSTGTEDTPAHFAQALCAEQERPEGVCPTTLGNLELNFAQIEAIRWGPHSKQYDRTFGLEPKSTIVMVNPPGTGEAPGPFLLGGPKESLEWGNNAPIARLTFTATKQGAILREEPCCS